MKSQLRLLSLSLSLLLASACLPALAIGNLADISIIDRNSGAALPIVRYQGEYWVAGTPGARYAVSVRNRQGQRLLAVPAVDGINVLSGQTAAWDQTGYVFNRFSQYQITGWRKSNSEVAAFEFAAISDSYASQTGRPANVGVIGVALFREKQPPPPAILQPEPRFQRPAVPPSSSSSSSRELSQNETADAAAPSAQDRSSPAPANQTTPSPTRQKEAGGSAELEASKSAPQASAKLGTAHGQRERSVVGSTAFERQSSQPDELVLIRYDSRANLIALGVIRPAPSQPNAFPESPTAFAPDFVPDPPKRRY